MHKTITTKAFQAAIDKQHFPVQDVASVKRLLDGQTERCFAGVHTLGKRSIPAIYVALGKKASRWGSKADGTPHIPDFKFNAITAKSGDVGFECLLRFPRGREVHLFLNPADLAVTNFLQLFAKSEIVAFSFYFHEGKMVYASYSSSDPDLQGWAERNLALAKGVAKDNEVGRVMAARRKMFWLSIGRVFVGAASKGVG
jgi:hypothetical protein